MQKNNLDNNIKEKLQNRTFQPSASAWERLSAQLDEQPKQKKRGWFFYIGAAASILLLIMVGFQIFSKNDDQIMPENIIVKEILDVENIDKSIDKFINEIPKEEAIVKVDKVEENDKNNATVILIKEEFYPKQKQVNIAKNDEINNKEKVIVQVAKRDVILDEKKSKNALQQNSNSRIKINSDDLLFAVTHSPQEVKTYYAKNNINRIEVLNTIKSELKKSNLKVNPETILAEVERTIIDDDFQNNFMKTLKRRVSDIATVIASRND
ncbi:hypothetical protein [uncultured Polaribacter sp.]|uniref:hypothetical protein n=1 Tax=uncultured Polaribacter sp. TaxID=174711 RepID=UPI0026396716|nr:hypothetical protein [uncultured Polaribacter sp.]